MSILITGGAGFIGSHTALELLDLNYDIIIADNFSNSKFEVIKRIQELSGKKIKTYNIDLYDYVALDKVFSENYIDAVIHLAGFKKLNESISEPIKYYRNNIDSTLNLLQVMLKHEVFNIVYGSTAMVYKISKELPLVEKMPTYCSNPYSCSKLMSEQIIKDAVKANKNLSAVILRYFNPVGAHESGIIGEDSKEPPNKLFPCIAQVAFEKTGKLKVYGHDYPTRDGTGIRDYIHITDLAKGNVKALEYTYENKGYEVFNIGCSIGYSVLEIIVTFERVNKVYVPFEVADRRLSDLAEYYADISKAKELLKWAPEKNLFDICRDVWRFKNFNPNGYLVENCG